MNGSVLCDIDLVTERRRPEPRHYINVAGVERELTRSLAMRVVALVHVEANVRETAATSWTSAGHRPVVRRFIDGRTDGPLPVG